MSKAGDSPALVSDDLHAGFNIGARMRAMRSAAGLSQRAGVRHAQISNVEKNKISPSMATLRRVLSGLGVGLADFFEPERQFPAGPFFCADELIDLTSKVAMSAIGDGSARWGPDNSGYGPQRRGARQDPQCRQEGRGHSANLGHGQRRQADH
ncbi:helix-turn-helix domain-containing protein [Microvirga sp. GCM10011540]|uniref:helix-turn-helix domain-containing protein n=1 Tax=Microvirga sp. GCM10011540 TaxID=3317338 RepID=UPI00361489D3